MSQLRCPDPAEYERAQYMRALQTFRSAGGEPATTEITA
jgi:hypothetical protein